MRVFTIINGYTGSLCLQELLDQGHEVVGVATAPFGVGLAILGAVGLGAIAGGSVIAVKGADELKQARLECESARKEMFDAYVLARKNCRDHDCVPDRNLIGVGCP